MSKLIILSLIILSCTACTPPKEMNAEVAKAIEVCLTKGWIPRYSDNGAIVRYTCKPVGVQ